MSKISRSEKDGILKLPAAENAFVPEAKIARYLLDLNHPTGHTKAVYFLRFGFRQAEWEVMAEALRRHAVSSEIVKVEDTPFGTRYTLEGTLQTPDQRNPIIRTGWLIDETDIPRFVTAIPVKRNRE
jgi:hypothetical protein